MTLTPRPGIMAIKPYVGGEAAIAGRANVVRLASNENPLGPSPKAVEAYGAQAGALHRYPDGAAERLRETIASVHGLDAARVVCGAGSDELIALLIRAYAGPGDEVVHSEHGFLMYAIAARAAGAKPVAAPERDLTADVDALLAKVGPKTRILFLANPNNPTGSYLPADELRRLRAGLTDSALLVLDAAYAEYVRADDYEAGAALVEAGDTVVMLRTFSKIHGLASLRLGWAYAPPDVVGVLNRIRGPFNVSRAAQDAGIAAQLDSDHVRRSADHNALWLTWFRDQVLGLGLQVAPSAGNFLLIRFPEAPDRGAGAAAAFLKDQGVLVRAMAAYGLPNCLRVTIGTEAEMRAVTDALAEFVARPA